MGSPLRVVKAMLKGGDDPATLQQRIDAVKAEAAAACVEIERLQSERALAPDYEAAPAIDERVRREQWKVEHADATLPVLEREFAALRTVHQARALAHHQSIIAALRAAAQIQAEVA